MSDDFFALPPFKPAEALGLLKRSLRDLRTLSERGDGYELKGSRVIELEADDKTITARLARRPMRGGTPEWDRFVLGASPDVRKFTDEVKRRLARWTEEDR
ncbi:hypothetical protein HLB44_06170 [Aquincola sp. S2]|uniref:Uncharacterized protein n=1 Tax=Pseudaquabacterium terrae TaxID=2732868 RepID=A0ABX2ECM8_9BURK|nr:hypothetical protein [Aquabacterium terrae]NRF66562.1 hypothetical protein [Aquabacterium terrae]